MLSRAVGLRDVVVLSARRPNDAGAVFFGGGLPDPRVCPTDQLARLLADVARHEPEAMVYGGGRGVPRLREAIANRLSTRSGTSIAAENIVVTNGSAGALDLLATTLLDPGDVVLVEALTYPGAVATFRQAGAELVAVPMDRDGLDTRALESILTAGANTSSWVKMIYTIATCQSPTATVLSSARRAELVRLAEQFDLLVVQDDTYGEIAFGDMPSPILSLAPERTVHVGSFSKTIAPGLRLGWIAGPTWLTDALAGVRGDLGTSPLLEHAVARFVESDFETYVAAISSHYREKRNSLLHALDEHCSEHGTWQVPQGGFFVWFTMNVGDLERLEPWAHGERVGFLPGPYFSAGPPCTRGLRLTYGNLTRDEMAEGIRRLGGALAQMGEEVDRGRESLG